MEVEIVSHPDFKVEFDGNKLGYPLHSIAEVTIPPHSATAVDVDIVNIRLPHGTFGWITSKDDTYVVGGGVIDEDYRGVVKVIVINDDGIPLTLTKGQLIAYMAIVRYGTAVFTGGTVSKAHDTDAGYDIHTKEDFIVGPSKYHVVHTGINITTDPNNPYMVHSRSGLSLKKCIIAVAEPDQEELVVRLINFSDKEVSFVEGDKIAQIVVHVVEHFIRAKTTFVEKIDTQTKRGTGGFGSSDVIKGISDGVTG
jgi:dUTP pyrophosphatase